MQAASWIHTLFRNADSTLERVELSLGTNYRQHTSATSWGHFAAVPRSARLLCLQMGENVFAVIPARVAAREPVLRGGSEFHFRSLAVLLDALRR